MSRKVFARGQKVEFQRDTNYGQPWERGEYLQGFDDWKGWHAVLAAFDGRTVHVPSRRIREMGVEP